MPESFNPYHQWLGLDAGLTKPDYYQLLGVPRQEQDAEEISQAADIAMSRVRQFRPGDKAREWASLLDELKEARSCLTDPARRAEYDQRLGNPATDSPPASAGQAFLPASPSATPSVAHPASQPAMGTSANPAPAASPTVSLAPASVPLAGIAAGSSSAATPARPANPPMASWATPVPSPASPTSVAPTVAASLRDAIQDVTAAAQPVSAPYSPAGSSPAGMNAAQNLAPQFPAHDPMAPFDPSQTQLPIASGPIASMPASNGSAVGGFGNAAYAGEAPQAAIPMGTAVSAAPAAVASPAPAMGKRSSVASNARKRANEGVQMLLVFAIAVMMIAVTGGILYVTLNDRSTPGPNGSGRPMAQAPHRPPQSQPNASSATPPPAAEPATPAAGLAAAPDERVLADRPSNDRRPSDAPRSSASPEMTEAEMAFVPTPPGGMATEEMPPAEPSLPEVTSPDATPTEPPSSEAPTPEPDVTPTPIPAPGAAPMAQPTIQDVQALAKSLTAAREALGEMNFTVAEGELAKAEPLAKLPEHQAKFDRLKELTNYVNEFHEALLEAIGGLEAGSEIRLSESNVVAIVEASPRVIVIRVAGANRRYAPNELPLGLAVAIADQWLDQGLPVSRVLKGAYVIVHKRASADNIAKARGWWQEASAGGLDVSHLMPVIDDRYDNLEADLN